MVNEKKIAFIICVTDDLYYNECLFYINQLYVPDGFETDVIVIRDADSMCSAYNAAMNESDAKYKVYLHQDVLIRNKNFISDILSIFKQDSEVGMIGMIGGNKMRLMGTWNTGVVDVRNPVAAYLISGKRNWNGTDVEVEAVDGILIATQYDLPWREDLFTHFDFYDISQSFEMRKAGYKVIVPYQEVPWVIHDCGYAKLKYYNEERHICMKEYPSFFYYDERSEIIFDEEWSKLNSSLADKAKELITMGKWQEVKQIIESYESIDKKIKGLDSDMGRLRVIYDIYQSEHDDGRVKNYFFEPWMTYDQILEKYIKTRFLLRRMELGMNENTYSTLVHDLIDERISLPALYEFIIHTTQYKDELINRLIKIYNDLGEKVCVSRLKRYAEEIRKIFPSVIYEAN